MQKLPVGQISKKLSSPFAKNISLCPSGKSNLQLAPSRPGRGAYHGRRYVGRDAMDATASGAQGIAGRVLS
jgi:hypothetical protein